MLVTTRPHEPSRVDGRRKPGAYAGGSRALMTSANSITNDVSITTPVRAPKLAVRSKAPAQEDDQDQVDVTCSRPATAGSVQATASSHSSERTVSPLPSRRASDQSQDSLERLKQQRRENERDLALSNSQLDLTKGKKKRSNVFGFLALKEPSQSAFDELAEAQRKAASQKGDRPASAGVSSQKLPTFVPRTNSKWDGLPDSTRKGLESRGKDNRSRRGSTISGVTHRTGHSSSSSLSNSSSELSPARRFGSLSSRPVSQAGLIPLSRKSSVASRPSGERRASERVAALGTLHPALQGKEPATANGPPSHQGGSFLRPSEVSPVDRTGNDRTLWNSQTFLHPPSPSDGPAELPASRFSMAHELPAAEVERFELEGSPLATPELEAPGMQPVAELAAYPVSSPEGSPHTPGAGVIAELPAEKLIDYRYIQIGDQTVAVDENSTFWNSDTSNDESIPHAARSGAGGRAPMNFSRPRRKRSTSSLGHLEPTIEEADEDDTFQSTLRNDKGQTELFAMEDAPPNSATQHARHPSSMASSHLPTVPERMSSTASRATDTTTTTASRPSHTFSEAGTEDTTRPSTANSTTVPDDTEPLEASRSNSDTASIAPSVMSAQWKLSPKERLGLGGKVRRSQTTEMAPWEVEGVGPSRKETSAAGKRRSDVSSKRLSSSSQAAGGGGGGGGGGSGQDGSKLKRLSMKLGGKKG
ncbi:hypothetical protein KC340_g2297 [Hortaea werneckii]|nr:hypothetical protein KC342_g1022 [Hortaea werneckii]KAI7107025.1 hypothetical protein KC339_g2680 [Hortaea werneckii]KAI7228617.1 hypothetical protein KC365_g8383 [Hortaea werneckii]KAI7334850.1 hypothetical protein KC340_g2297 [Hortaea werneckii]KAI7374822.1 hypothetical protein KC328_g15808 [Hortaea werneckii]